MKRVQARVEEDLQRSPARRHPRLRAAVALSAAIATAATVFLISSESQIRPASYSAQGLAGGIVRHRSTEAHEPQPVLFDQHSIVRWVARPADDRPHADTEQRGVLLGKPPSGPLRILETDLSPSRSGAYVVRRVAADYFGELEGSWRLLLVIGDRESLTDAALEEPLIKTNSIAVFHDDCEYMISEEN